MAFHYQYLCKTTNKVSNTKSELILRLFQNQFYIIKAKPKSNSLSTFKAKTSFENQNIKENFWIRSFKQKFNKILKSKFTLKIKTNHSFTFNFQFDFENQFLKFKTGNKNRDSLAKSNCIACYHHVNQLYGCYHHVNLKKNAFAKLKFNQWTIVIICILPHLHYLNPFNYLNQLPFSTG